MAYDSNKGVSALGAVLTDRMKEVNGLNPAALDFGQIQGDYSLKCNTYAQAIPKTDYSVLMHLTMGEAIAPGNRVLVAWVNNEAVVVGRVSRF
nr:MAG TPA: hypothetical protein [Caudoviricetes sp.]